MKNLISSVLVMVTLFAVSVQVYATPPDPPEYIQDQGTYLTDQATEDFEFERTANWEGESSYMYRSANEYDVLNDDIQVVVIVEGQVSDDTYSDVDDTGPLNCEAELINNYHIGKNKLWRFTNTLNNNYQKTSFYKPVTVVTSNRYTVQLE